MSKFQNTNFRPRKEQLLVVPDSYPNSVPDWSSVPEESDPTTSAAFHSAPGTRHER